MARVKFSKRRMNRGSRFKKRTKVQKRPQRWPRGSGIAALRLAARSYKVPRAVGTPFPYSRLVKHKYVEQVIFPAAAAPGGPRQYVFSANGTFDPNITGTGHQPIFRDEMAALYKYYVVLASYAKVTFTDSNTTQQNYGCIVSQDTTFSSNSQTLMEQYGYQKMSTNSQRNYSLTVRGKYDAVKKQKTTFRALIGNTDQQTDAGNNPGVKQQFFYNFWSAPFDTSVTLAAQNAFVEIIYITMWLQPQDAVGS